MKRPSYVNAAAVAPRTVLARPPEPLAAMVGRMRVRAGLSQNALARRAGIDPAYVNRIERVDVARDPVLPSRRVILRLWDALEGSVEDRDRLLVASGHCPEGIMALGWDGYVRTVTDRIEDALDGLHRALTLSDPLAERGGRS